MKRVTQKDVAIAAGVSRATVSYVLNGRLDGNIRVSEETRAKILEAMESLNYRVNLNARSLKTNRTQQIAILVPDLGNPFYPELIRGAQKLAHSRDYRILIVDSFSQEQDERDFLDMALNHIADGLILASSYLGEDDIKVLLEEGIPSVGVGPRLANAGIDTVSIDQNAAVRKVIEHFVSRGHSRIAHLTGDLNNINGRIRHDSFLAGMEAMRLDVDPAWVAIGDFLRQGTAQSVQSWFRDLPVRHRPTALFAANDLMAIEAIKAFRKMGLRVPDDIAVCGFDNIPEAEYVEPPLTSLGHDVTRMGEEAARHLMDRIEDPDEESGRQIDLPFELYVRKST